MGDRESSVTWPSSAGRTALACAALAACLLALRVEPASACSCAGGDPRMALAGADAAFVGVYLDRRPAPGSGGGLGSSIYSFRVQEVVKGSLDQQVDVVSSSSGASCGIEATPGQILGLLLYRSSGVWTSNLCRQMSPARLRDAARPLPAPDGSGPPAFAVTGRFGDFSALALDRRARTLAYGSGTGDAYALAACPGGTRTVEMTRDGPWRLVVRGLPRLGVLRRVTLPFTRSQNLWPEALLCRDSTASGVYVFASNYGSTSGRRPATSHLLLVRGQRVSTVHRGTAVYASFAGGGKAFLNEGLGGRDIVSVALPSGRESRVARVPRGTGPLRMSPDGKRLAGVAYSAPIGRSPPPSRVVLIDLSRKPARVRTAALTSANVTGTVSWLSPARFVFLPDGGESDFVRIYSTSLRVLERGKLSSWWARDAVVVNGVAYGLAGEFILRAALPAGPVVRIRTLPSPQTYRLVALPGARVAGGR